jgi:hypothetical protein
MKFVFTLMFMLVHPILVDYEFQYPKGKCFADFHWMVSVTHMFNQLEIYNQHFFLHRKKDLPRYLLKVVLFHLAELSKRKVDSALTNS